MFSSRTKKPGAFQGAPGSFGLKAEKIPDQPGVLSILSA
ncbi:hypothetical protein SAMN06272759_106249 [Novosphingobium sp. B1]|nr:hypothetical protein SAMN06272759_106249 [Novosphingobium sp. B1]